METSTAIKPMSDSMFRVSNLEIGGGIALLVLGCILPHLSMESL